MSDLMDNSQENIAKTDEEKKQNDLLARREARRRRILENAKSRLDKLSGGTDRNSTTANKSANNHTEIYSNPEIDHPECMNTYFVPKYTTQSENIQNETTWDSTPLLQTPEVEPPTAFEKFLNTRIHVVVASTITYILLLSLDTAFISHSLFGLFLMTECLELLRFHKEKPLNPIVNMVLMLSGLNVPMAGVFIKIFGLVQKILTDLGLFVFSFVMCHGFYCLVVEGTGDQIFSSF